MAVMRRTPRSAGRPGRCGGGRRRRRGAADGDGRDTDAGALERREDGRDGGGTALRAGAQRATVDQRLTDAGDTRDGVDRSRVGAAVGQLDDDRVAAQLGLQLLRRAGRDDPAAVDDGELAGEAIGLVEVVGRQEDRQPVLPGEAADSVHSSARASGSRPVVGSSRKRICGRWMSPVATSSLRRMPPE